jgi:hypothetical protein
MTINVLAGDRVMDRTTLGRNILPLQRDGLIVVERGSRDRRSKTPRLTDSRVARFRAASKRWVHAQRHFEAAFGAKRTKDLRALLHTVAATDLTTAVDINESSGSGLREIPLDLRLANARRCGTPRLLNDTSKPHSASKNEGPSPQQEDHEAERGNTATEGTRCAEMAAPDRQILLTNPMPARWRQAAGTIISGMSLWNGFSIDSSRSGAAYSDTVGFGLGIQQRRKLRMAAGAPVINDLLPSRARATSAPTFLFDHRQREVDHPGQGPHRAVDDENSIFLHPSLLGTEPASHLRGTSAWSGDGHGAGRLRPARTRRRTVEVTDRDRSKAWRRNLIKPVSTIRSRSSRKQSSVSKFVLSNGSVATPAPIELLMEPPVLDSRRP